MIAAAGAGVAAAIAIAGESSNSTVTTVPDVDLKRYAGKWFELAALARDGREIPIEMTVWLVSDRGRRTFHSFIRDISKLIASSTNVVRFPSMS